MKPQRITSQWQLDVLVLERRRERGARAKGRDRKAKRERETEMQKGGGLVRLSELKSLSFFTIETDSHNM